MFSFRLVQQECALVLVAKVNQILPKLLYLSSKEFECDHDE